MEATPSPTQRKLTSSQAACAMKEKPSAAVAASKGWPLHRWERGISDQAVLILTQLPNTIPAFFLPLSSACLG